MRSCITQKNTGGGGGHEREEGKREGGGLALANIGGI